MNIAAASELMNMADFNNARRYIVQPEDAPLQLSTIVGKLPPNVAQDEAFISRLRCFQSRYALIALA